MKVKVPDSHRGNERRVMEKIEREKYRTSSVVALLLGASTLVSAPASKPCALGYYAYCSWTPYSTLICPAIAGAILWIDRRRS